MTLTDRADATVLGNLAAAVRLNGCGDRVRVQALPWGDVQATAAIAPTPNVILGADCFYHVSDFDHVLATATVLLRQAAAAAEWTGAPPVFLTCYQERSSRRTIQHLLDFWGLRAEAIVWQPTGDGLSADLSDAVLDSLHLLCIQLATT